MGSVPPGAVIFWSEVEPLPAEWEWLPLKIGVGSYRIMWERLIGGEDCLRPARKV